MQQGKVSRKKQMDARRRFFQSQATAGGRAPAGQPPPGTTTVQQPGVAPAPAPAPVMETQPGAVPTIPAAQIQHHQARQLSGLPGSQPVGGQPVLAPQSGTQVAVIGGPTAVRDNVLQSRMPQIPVTPRGDVTVILYSSGEQPQLLAQQLDAIRRQTMQPGELYVHVDGSSNHDERSLMKLGTARTPMNVGRHFRLALAREAKTKYVAILEEDAIPGSRWLERAVLALTQADGEEHEAGPAVVACSGVLQGSPDPADAHPVGPELPRGDATLVVDFGRQGWVFAREFARVAESLLRVGSSSDSLGILLAAAAGGAGIPTVVLDYGQDRENWGTTQPKSVGLDPHDTAAAFAAYLDMGWDPSFEGRDLRHAAQPAAAPAGQPTIPGGEWKETKLGESVVRERVLGPNEQTPNPNEGRETILDGGQQTPPPLSSHTEQVVAPSPPPPSAETERVVASTPPKSGTGR